VWIRLATHPSVLRRALATAAVVGVILTLVNHGGEVLGGRLRPDHAWPIAFTFLVPFAVATISSIAVTPRPGAGRGERIPSDEVEEGGTFPDANPKPVFRIGSSGVLLYANPALPGTILLGAAMALISAPAGLVPLLVPCCRTDVAGFGRASWIIRAQPDPAGPPRRFRYAVPLALIGPIHARIGLWRCGVGRMCHLRLPVRTALPIHDRVARPSPGTHVPTHHHAGDA